MAKLRLGVIGAGSWAVASHLPNLERHADAVEFAAVSRLGREPLERIRKRFGFQIASEDYHDVINAGIDICVVSSPSGFHYEHAKAALEAGAHVLVEKPVTIDPKQAWDLVELAKRLKRHVVVSFGWNYKPMVREAKRLMMTRLPILCPKRLPGLILAYPVEDTGRRSFRTRSAWHCG